MKELLMQKLEEYQVGLEDALNKRDSSITGMGFSIWSGSFVNHAIYAAMEASTLTKQENAANKEYQKEIDALHRSITGRHDGAKKKYIDEVYIPNMESAIAVFAFELLDTYISDLIKNGKINKDILNYINIDRSNDLLKNLELSSNKVGILHKAFEACPYNQQVYSKVLSCGFMDQGTYQTAQYFGQGKNILYALVGNLGEVEYPNRFSINYDVAAKMAELTHNDVVSILQAKTKDYATAVVKTYGRVSYIISDSDRCNKIIKDCDESAILAGSTVSSQKAHEYVDSIVESEVWSQLVSDCGHADLLDRVKKYIPENYSASTKYEIDTYFIATLTEVFERARKSYVSQIKIRKQAEQAEKERLEKISARKKARRKKIIKGILIGIGSIIAAIIALFGGVALFLMVTDKPIDEDFTQSYKDNLHSLVYHIPENWDYYSDASNDNETWYTRYDNWGNFLGSMIVTYEGEVPDVSVDSVIAEFQEECATAESRTKDINGQEFSLITFELESDDATPFFYNIYVTEEDYSVFYISFIFVEESNKPDVFEEIVGAVAFDEYVNPKEETYNKALDFMSSEKYDEALYIFTELGGYKDSLDKLAECKKIIMDAQYEKAIKLIEEGDYEEAYKIIVGLGNYRDCLRILKNFNVVYQKEHIENYAGDWEGTYSYTYDSLGRLLVEDYKNGTMVYKYSYDDNKLISMVLTVDSIETNAISYAYNSEGLLTASSSVNHKGELTLTEHFYNDGLLAKTVATDDDGSYETTTFSYDMKGQLIKEYSQSVNEYHPEGYPYETTIEYSYDETGHMLTETWTFDDGDISVTKYIYDAYDCLIKEIRSDGDDIIEYKYDANHFLISKSDISDGEVDAVTEYSNHLVFYKSSENE